MQKSGNERNRSPKNLSSHDIVLTTYGTVSSEYEAGSIATMGIFATNFRRVILDEAHTIKSSVSVVSKGIRKKKRKEK